MPVGRDMLEQQGDGARGRDEGPTGKINQVLAPLFVTILKNIKGEDNIKSFVLFISITLYLHI